MSKNLEKGKNCRKKSEIRQKVNITLPDTIGLHHCILCVLPVMRFWIHQQQLVHLLLNPGTYECIIIIQVTTRITDSPLLIPTTCHPSLWILSPFKLNSSVHLFHDRTWNGTMFTNHNQLITPQKKLQKNHRRSISILHGMKKILHNFHWNPPSKMRKGDLQTLKTSSCEILLWVLRPISVAIVTNYKNFKNEIIRHWKPPPVKYRFGR